MFSKVFGCLGGALGGHVGSSWRDVGLCWASWAPSWSNLATRLIILGDVWTSWRQGWRTRAQDAADDRKGWIFGGLGWGRDRRNPGKRSRVPPLKKLQRKGLELPPPPGAPNSTWKLVELRLWLELETRRTQAVAGALYSPGHAHGA